MSDKTCGTCQHCAKRHGSHDGTANRVCMHMGCLLNDWDTCNCAGMYYEERTDSVEQVALDMLAWINQHVAVGGAPFALRMFALGMEVPDAKA